VFVISHQVSASTFVPPLLLPLLSSSWSLLVVRMACKAVHLLFCFVGSRLCDGSHVQQGLFKHSRVLCYSFILLSCSSCLFLFFDVPPLFKSFVKSLSGPLRVPLALSSALNLRSETFLAFSLASFNLSCWLLTLTATILSRRAFHTSLLLSLRRLVSNEVDLSHVIALLCTAPHTVLVQSHFKIRLYDTVVRTHHSTIPWYVPQYNPIMHGYHA
jgi:hypothetical protein